MGYDPHRFISSFVGFLPVERAEFVCIVVVDSPKGTYWGSKVAAPVFRRIMKRILSLRDTEMRHRAVVEAREREGAETSAPVLAGLSTNVAKRVMDRHGLNPTRVNAGATSSVKAQVLPTEIRESRRATASVDSAKTDESVTMPDVVGIPLRQAVVQLTSSGLVVSASGSGIVVSQTPGVGMPVAPGTACNVVCSPRKAPIPNNM